MQMLMRRFTLGWELAERHVQLQANKETLNKSCVIHSVSGPSQTPNSLQVSAMVTL